MSDHTTQTDAPTSTPDVGALLRASKRATRTVPICLRSDLVAEVEHLDRELAVLLDVIAAEKAQKPAIIDDRLTDAPAGPDPRAVALADRIEALRAEMRASTVDFVVRAMAPKRWREFCDEHKPRKDPDDPKRPHPDDAAMGINVTTFWEPLVRACLISPREVLEPDTWELLMGRGVPTDDDPDADQHGLSDNQWDTLCGAAWQVNRGKVDIPFSWAASRVIRS